MKRLSRFPFLAFAALPALACAAAEPTASADAHRALLDRYCVECHNTTDWAGGVAFDAMTFDSLGEDSAVWETTIRKLRGGLMPPPGKAQPEARDSKAMVGWLEGGLDAVARDHPDPGYVGLHRLNRREYANACLV
ncbi:MAG: hypothetical protein EOO66_30135 [Methylobacterium sp.]|nr:MAG: hypothetical protein EOO66_30135 [Methylobacterium sp.]